MNTSIGVPGCKYLRKLMTKEWQYYAQSLASQIY
jgi:hypothetical protein